MKVTPTPGSVSGRRVDRIGDPLEGLVNLFDLSLVLAVGLLLAALSSAGVVGLVSGPAGSGGQPISGQPQGGGSTSGTGQEVGKVYRLADGSYVFSPSGGASATAGTGSVAPSTSTPTGATGTAAPTTSTGGGLDTPQTNGQPQTNGGVTGQ
jgi:hypothetical protein